MLSIVIPTYNEAKNIIKLINRILSLNEKVEIIIVDDNSPDGTAKEIIKNFYANKKIKLIVRKKKRGLGTAILEGIKVAKGKIIVGIDADFNHPPELIPKLIENVKNYEFVVASRFIKGGGMEDKFRYFFTYLFNLFLKYILGFPTMDNMSGFYAIKKEKLRLLPLNKIYYGYGEYHLRLVWYAKIFNFKIKEIPVYYKKRNYGKSKSNLLKMFFIYILNAIKLKFKL
ncbi:MAG: glycosyltransferase [Microgenomates group bacterium]